jgi:hypothetical protein
MMTWFAAALDPEPRYLPNLGPAVQAIKDRLRVDWQMIQGQHVLRSIEQQWVFMASPNRIAFQTLGWKYWEKEQEQVLAALGDGLERLGAEQIKRFGFKTLTFIPMQMTHAEIVKLIFGSVLVDSDQLEPVCGEMDDMFVNLWAKKNGMKYVMSVLPQTAEQVVQHAAGVGNLDNFMDNPWGDGQMRAFVKRITTDTLTVDIDFGAADQPVGALSSFVKKAIVTGDEIREKLVTKVKGMTFRNY